MLRTLSSLLLSFVIVVNSVSFATARIFDSGVDEDNPAFKRLTLYEQTIVRAVGDVTPSVVSIVVKTQVADPRIPIIIREDTATGSGFVIPGNIIVTNKHVVQLDPENVQVVYNGKEYKAEVIALAPHTDLAFLSINNGVLTPVRLAETDDVFIGQTVIAIGNPVGLPNSVTTGVLSAVDRKIRAQDLDNKSVTELNGVYQTDAAINPGNSGGPLVNSLGEVIGVNTAMGQNTENIGFAIRIKEVRDALKSFNRSGKIEQTFLGVAFTEVDASVKTSLSLRFPYGAYINTVIEGSAADNAGIQVGDVILRVNRDNLRTNSLDAAISEFSPGAKATLWLWRPSNTSRLGTTKRVTVIFGSR
jgi:serine protease Do